MLYKYILKSETGIFVIIMVGTLKGEQTFFYIMIRQHPDFGIFSEPFVNLALAVCLTKHHPHTFYMVPPS